MDAPLIDSTAGPGTVDSRVLHPNQPGLTGEYVDNIVVTYVWVVLLSTFGGQQFWALAAAVW